MNKNDFVTGLRKLIPSKEDYLKRNFSEKFIEREMKSYQCTPKDPERFDFKYNGNIEVLDLLQSFDCTNLEIGIMSFYFNPKENTSHFLIGDVEQDLLTINKVTLEVEVLDIHDRKTLIWPCAANSGFFLDAVLTCMEYTSLCIKNENLDSDKQFETEYLFLAIERAGGGKYEEFYKLIFGIFEE